MISYKKSTHFSHNWILTGVWVYRKIVQVPIELVKQQVLIRPDLYARIVKYLSCIPNTEIGRLEMFREIDKQDKTDLSDYRNNYIFRYHTNPNKYTVAHKNTPGLLFMIENNLWKVKYNP